MDIDKVRNCMHSIIERADEKLSSSAYIHVLLGFWIAIFLTGILLLITTIITFKWTVFAIGMMDITVGAGFGVYYYIQRMWL